MSPSFAKRSAELQIEILQEDFYIERYKNVLKKHGLTIEQVQGEGLSKDTLHVIWESFWWALPDSPSIRTPIFFKVCDLCEEE